MTRKNTGPAADPMQTLTEFTQSMEDVAPQIRGIFVSARNSFKDVGFTEAQAEDLAMQTVRLAIGGGQRG